MAESLWREKALAEMGVTLKPQSPRWQRVCGGERDTIVSVEETRRSPRDGREFVAAAVYRSASDSPRAAVPAMAESLWRYLEATSVSSPECRSPRDGREFVADTERGPAGRDHARRSPRDGREFVAESNRCSKTYYSFAAVTLHPASGESLPS